MVPGSLAHSMGPVICVQFLFRAISFRKAYEATSLKIYSRPTVC